MIKLLHGDCIEQLLNVEENSIDCVITDPPYNISRENNFQTMGSASRIGMDFGEWDKDFNLTEYINLLPRILKDNSNVVIFNAWENLKEIKDACEVNHIAVKRCLVLNKTNPAPFNRDRMFVNDVEFALWGVYNSKDKQTNWTFNRINPLEKCVIDTQVQESTLHPTMKDLDVIKYLVKLLSNTGDTVLDCFMGSGTTGVACKDLGRNFVGIERDDKYFEVASNRINNHVRGEKDTIISTVNSNKVDLF